MTAEARRVWLETLCVDLAHKTLAEIMDGSRRYRTTPGNRWFPISGDWLQAMKNPWDDAKPRRYQPLDDLPPPVPERDAMALIERTRAKYGYRADPGRTPVASRQREIADRQPIPHEPSNPDTLAEMRAKLAGKVEA